MPLFAILVLAGLGCWCVAGGLALVWVWLTQDTAPDA